MPAVPQCRTMIHKAMQHSSCIKATQALLKPETPHYKLLVKRGKARRIESNKVTLTPGMQLLTPTKFMKRHHHHLGLPLLVMQLLHFLTEDALHLFKYLLSKEIVLNMLSLTTKNYNVSVKNVILSICLPACKKRESAKCRIMRHIGNA